MALKIIESGYILDIAKPKMSIVQRFNYIVKPHNTELTLYVISRARMDELRIFLEVEAWEVCPVRSTFTIHKLRVSLLPLESSKEKNCLTYPV